MGCRTQRSGPHEGVLDSGATALASMLVTALNFHQIVVGRERLLETEAAIMSCRRLVIGRSPGGPCRPMAPVRTGRHVVMPWSCCSPAGSIIGVFAVGWGQPGPDIGAAPSPPWHPPPRSIQGTMTSSGCSPRRPGRSPSRSPSPQRIRSAALPRCRRSPRCSPRVFACRSADHDLSRTSRNDDDPPALNA